MKYFCLAIMAACVIAACWYDVVLVRSLLNLPETSLLWRDGVVAGWFQMVVYVACFDGMILIPVWMMWDSYNDLKKG